MDMQIGEALLSLTSAAFSCDSHLPLPLPPTLACSAPLSSELDKRYCLSCSLKHIYSQVIFHNTIVLLSEAMDHCSCSPLYGRQWHLLQGKIKPTLVVLTLFPVLQLHPFRSGSTLHSSPSMQGCIWHHHFWATMDAVKEKVKKDQIIY